MNRAFDKSCRFWNCDSIPNVGKLRAIHTHFLPHVMDLVKKKFGWTGPFFRNFSSLLHNWPSKCTVSWFWIMWKNCFYWLSLAAIGYNLHVDCHWVLSSYRSQTDIMPHNKVTSFITINVNSTHYLYSIICSNGGGEIIWKYFWSFSLFFLSLNW